MTETAINEENKKRGNNKNETEKVNSTVKTISNVEEISCLSFLSQERSDHQCVDIKLTCSNEYKNFSSHKCLHTCTERTVPTILIHTAERKTYTTNVN